MAFGETTTGVFIHYTSSKRNTTNVGQYIIGGKTRVGREVHNFTGTITLTGAKLSEHPIIMSTTKESGRKDYTAYVQGVASGTFELFEDSVKEGGGHISATFKTEFYLDAKGDIFYDDLDNISDNYCNNQFIGTWVSYKSAKAEKCNWGDYRIPDCHGLDIGAGEFSVNDKYLKFGWQNFSDANTGGGDTPKQHKAIAIEEEQWWR